MGFVSNCLRGKILTPPPIWIMRQAGRYLPEFREIRAQYPDFFGLCFSPQVVKEITLQPIKRFDFDAAIIFSDILVIPLARGQKVQFVKGEGPQLGPLTNNSADLSSLEPVYEAISLTASSLSKEKDLIGFSGAPWTILTYMIEQGKSSSFSKLHKMIETSPSQVEDLIESLTGDIADHLDRQIKAGATVVQIFDSWAESVPVSQRQAFILDPLKKITKRIGEKVPIIFFGRGISGFYPTIANEIPNISFGLDESVSLSKACQDLPHACLQGNLDPKILLEGGQKLRDSVNLILKERGGHPFVFNLGHGILPATPIAHVEELLRLIRNGSEENSSHFIQSRRS